MIFNLIKPVVTVFVVGSLVLAKRRVKRLKRELEAVNEELLTTKASCAEQTHRAVRAEETLGKALGALNRPISDTMAESFPKTFPVGDYN